MKVIPERVMRTKFEIYVLLLFDCFSLSFNSIFVPGSSKVFYSYKYVFPI